MTTLLTSTAGDHPPPGPSASTIRDRAGSSFTALTRSIHEMGLMRRSYGYYWAKLIGAVLILTAWVVGFTLIGDSWWQLANAAVLAVVMTQIAFLGHDAAHRQMFKSGRWNDWVSLIIANLMVGISYGWWQSKHNRHHANPNKEGADPDIALTALALTPARATKHRGRLMSWLVAHQGWYFFPILLLEGLSLHHEGIRRVISPGKFGRRWVELSFLTFRLAGLIALVFLVLSPEKAVVFLAVELAIFGLYMGSSFAPNHIGMPLVSPKLKLDFLRRQVLMSRNISGGPLISIFMGGLNYQIEHHLFPSMARPHLRKAQPLVSAYCAAQGVPYTRTNLWQAYRSVIGYLNTVGLQGKDPSCVPSSLNVALSSQSPTPRAEGEWRRQAQLGPAEHGLRPEYRCPARGRRCSRLWSAFESDRHGRSRRFDGGWLCSICDGYARGLASQNGIKPQPIDLPSRISQLACHLLSRRTAG